MYDDEQLGPGWEQQDESERQRYEVETMRVDEVYSGSTIKASDLQGKAVKCVIQAYQVKEFEEKEGTRRKVVLTFEGRDKQLVCNKTNSRRIATMHGEEMDLWIGKQITLQPEKVEFGSDMVDAIRVRLVQAQPEFDETIPF